jgi:hypothetical protein
MSLLFASMAAAAPVVVRAAGDATADFQPEELRQSNNGRPLIPVCQQYSYLHSSTVQHQGGRVPAR